MGHREEKKEKHAEEQADDSELMDWRWKQSDEMKAAVAEKMQAEREVDLMNSKAFQEFKRERRALLREEELDQIQEAYLQDGENARAMEQTLEMANLARELTREKERLLESL